MLGGPYTISATMSPAGVLSNYSITYNTAQFTISPKVASVTPSAASKTYGDADPAFTGTLSGFLSADAVAATYTRTAGETVLGGPYTISATLSPAGVLSNYSITYNTAQFTISPKVASVTPSAASKTYGDADPAFTGTLSGFLSADAVAATYTRTVGETVLGGPYAISATLSPEGVLGNYTITYNTASFTINARPITVTADAQTKVYGSADPALTYQITAGSLVSGDSFRGALTRVAGEHVANSPNPIQQGTLTAGSNYNLTYVGANMSITPASLAVTVSPQTKVYGQTDPALTYLATGFQFSDTASTVLTGSLTRTAGEHVSGSPYAITQGNLAANADYIISFTGNVLTITPAPLTVTVNNATRPCGQPNPAFSLSYSGFVNGDSASSLSGSPSFSTTATINSPPGTYSVTASGLTSTDYAITYVPGTLTITSGTMGAGFIYVLDPTAGGALSLSGNATINVAQAGGNVYVDSSSASAVMASGNAQVKAAAIQVHGGVQKNGNALFSPAPVTGAPAVPDPLASLPLPARPSLPSDGSESVSGNSVVTINPGIYSKISVSGNANLTMTSGTYIIQGGGFTASSNAIVTFGAGSSLIIEGGGVSISGNASVSGTRVTIFNVGSSYNPATGIDGGSFDAISVSGNGTISLTPPSSGTYSGILIDQARDNARAITLSGNAMQGVTGTIYAAAAQLVESGNAQVGTTSNPISLVVDTLSLSGNSIANGLTLSAPGSTVAYTPDQIRAAYGISGLSLDGTGQTIAIVDAYDDPSIYQALDTFDSQFGLTSSGPTLYAQYGPASSFLTVLNQYGQATSLPSTDPNGPGGSNWEVEEALDVEWAHAIALGAQIILVEANSQSLSDLMASVATAASQPSVSVVSMSWGFAEGQAVFASDEAAYDSVFNVPGVTFVASTGDYGAADPEYPAFSPNVVAVGGTSLTLNTDGSYNSETGWGYYSDSAGALIASGGGISQYETEPAYQQGVQSTSYRTTPDVSLVADPATGAWIADPYNLDPSNPFEVVGGTSLSAPAWSGLFALANQGRASAGESTLNSSSPTDDAAALYMLPQSDYNVMASGNNGYTAGSGYNLVTGLGTPVAGSLVPDLVAYQGRGTTYNGPTVAPLQNANLVNTGTSSSSPIDVFSVFDSITVANNGIGHAGAVSSGSADRAVLKSIAPGSPGAGSIRPAGASFQTQTPGTSSQSIMALDSVISNWTPVSSSVMKRLTTSMAGGTVSLAIGRGLMLPVVNMGKRSPVLDEGIVDVVGAGGNDIPSLFAVSPDISSGFHIN